MLPVIGVHVVCRFQALAETDHGGLFTEIEVTVATNASFGVHLTCFLLEAANEQHLVVVVEKCTTVFVLREWGMGLLADSCLVLHIRL
jgi:hypothetical protein